METNQNAGESEPFGALYSANDAIDRTDQGPERAHPWYNRVFRVGNSSNDAVAPAIASRGPFPLRTLMVCFTIWLIATQAMIFDQIKFDERVHLLEQAARPLGGPQGVVPNERPSSLPSGAKMQIL